MDVAVKLAPTVGIVALCAALGLSRATFHRRQRAVRIPAPPPMLTGVSSSDKVGGRSPVAVCGHGTQSATAPPTPLVPATDVDAARSRGDLIAPSRRRRRRAGRDTARLDRAFKEEVPSRALR